MLNYTKTDLRNLMQLYDLDDRFVAITTEGTPEEVVTLLNTRGVKTKIVQSALNIACS